MEDGRIPKKKANLEAIARYYNVPETSLFIDPELSSGGGAHAESPTVSALTKIIEQQDQRIKELEKHAENPIVSRLLKLSPKDQKTISDLMLSLEWQRDELAKVNEAAKLPKLVKKRG